MLWTVRLGWRYLNPTSTAAVSSLGSIASQLSACQFPQHGRTMASKHTREWTQPANGVKESDLMLYNSLIDEKVPFIPAAGPQSKQITWYTCGPTVYDSAHMGHARNYVTMDIIRRVLEDYFGYNILYVMNVTDVDDKIILRARRNHLLRLYRESGKSSSEVFAYALKAVQASFNKQSAKHATTLELVAAAEQELQQQPEKRGAALKKKEELDTAARNEMHKLSQVKQALDALQALRAGSATLDAILAVAGDYVAEALDKEQGHTVTDPDIFRAHAARYEGEFNKDMDALGVRRPDVSTRVSEYIPEIVDYIKKIMDNGMGYASNGSVYFDTTAFRAGGHTYGKLKPWAVGSAALAAEGEANFETSEKRNPCDFALWKAAKPGEPHWESPWGRGRPGWHIECSAMASSILGCKMDIHSGGEDLRFPHHDNELAQAEAHYHDQNCHQWVNYFLHSGHLEIEGLKMSKSLKNFITIRAEMRAKEATLKNFFQNVEAATRNINELACQSRWQGDEMELWQRLQSVQQQVHACLLDNINTAGAMDALCELIKHVNIYLAKKQDAQAAAAAPLQPLLLRKAAAYITRILSVFGIVDSPADRPGLNDGGAFSGDSRGASYLDAFTSFRDEVRTLARSKAEPREILSACDRVRDDVLPGLGVRLEDRPDGTAVWKLDDPAVLRAEREERARLAAEAAHKKLAGALDRKMKEKEKFEKLLSLPGVTESLVDKYSRFDPTTGEPTHDKDGKELEGKAKDKAKKDLDKAKKILEPLHKKQAEDPDFMSKLEQEIQELTQQLQQIKP